MARFSFSIPDNVAELLDNDVEQTGKSRSSLIAEYIERYYKGESQSAESKDIVQRTKVEHEKKVQQLIDGHDAEMQQIRAECEKQVQQRESELGQLETNTKKLSNDLKASEERNASSVERLRQSETSKSTVVSGLQHEVELLQQRNASLENTLHTERGHLSELRQDKETLQKQLELVTLRLPSPKVGFWSRIFGGGRKKEE